VFLPQKDQVRRQTVKVAADAEVSLRGGSAPEVKMRSPEKGICKVPLREMDWMCMEGELSA